MVNDAGFWIVTRMLGLSVGDGLNSWTVLTTTADVLYVSDTSAALRDDGHHHIVAFDVVAGRVLANPRVFAVIEPGLPDGFRVDRRGWLFTSSASGVQVFHPDGTRLAHIPVPEKVGNLAFGGAEGNALFIAASTSLYRLRFGQRLT